MRPITLKSMGQVVAVMPHELLEFHQLGLGWYEYEKLRAPQSHSEALAAARAVR